MFFFWFFFICFIFSLKLGLLFYFSPRLNRRDFSPRLNRRVIKIGRWVLYHLIWYIERIQKIEYRYLKVWLVCVFLLCIISLYDYFISFASPGQGHYIDILDNFIFNLLIVSFLITRSKINSTVNKMQMPFILTIVIGISLITLGFIIKGIALNTIGYYLSVSLYILVRTTYFLLKRYMQNRKK